MPPPPPMKMPAPGPRPASSSPPPPPQPQGGGYLPNNNNNSSTSSSRYDLPSSSSSAAAAPGGAGGMPPPNVPAGGAGAGAGGGGFRVPPPKRSPPKLTAGNLAASSSMGQSQPQPTSSSASGTTYHSPDPNMSATTSNRFKPPPPPGGASATQPPGQQPPPPPPTNTGTAQPTPESSQPASASHSNSMNPPDPRGASSSTMREDQQQQQQQEYPASRGGSSAASPPPPPPGTQQQPSSVSRDPSVNKNTNYHNPSPLAASQSMSGVASGTSTPAASPSPKRAGAPSVPVPPKNLPAKSLNASSSGTYSPLGGPNVDQPKAPLPNVPKRLPSPRAGSGRSSPTSAASPSSAAGAPAGTPTRDDSGFGAPPPPQQQPQPHPQPQQSGSGSGSGWNMEPTAAAAANPMPRPAAKMPPPKTSPGRPATHSVDSAVSNSSFSQTYSGGGGVSTQHQPLPHHTSSSMAGAASAVVAAGALRSSPSKMPPPKKMPMTHPSSSRSNSVHQQQQQPITAHGTSSPKRVAAVLGPPPEMPGSMELGSSGMFLSGGAAVSPPRVTKGAASITELQKAEQEFKAREGAQQQQQHVSPVGAESPPRGASVASGGAVVPSPLAGGKKLPSVPRRRPTPTGTPTGAGDASPSPPGGRLQSVSPASSPINFNNASPQGAAARAGAGAGHADPYSAAPASVAPGAAATTSRSGSAQPPANPNGPNVAPSAAAAAAAGSLAASHPPPGGGGVRGPVKGAPPKMDPSKLRPEMMARPDGKKAPGPRPTSADGTLNNSANITPSGSQSNFGGAGGGARPPAPQMGGKKGGVLTADNLAASQRPVTSLNAVAQAARLSVPVSVANMTGKSVPVPGQQQQIPHHLMMGNPMTARPVSLAISSDEDDDDEGAAATGALVVDRSSHGHNPSSASGGVNSLRRAVVVVRPATTAPAVPLWVQHVVANSNRNSAASGAITPSRAIMSPLSAATHNANNGSRAALGDASSVGGAAAQSNPAVRSFVLHHFGKRTQGLLHDIFRTLVQMAQQIDGEAAQQPILEDSSVSPLRHQQQQQQQQQQQFNPQVVCTFASTICFVAMALRMHDRKFAMQHSILLSFANAATGGISGEAYRPVASLDVETWVNTLIVVLDNTRTSTSSFAAALLEEDLAVPNYVAHARAAGRHDAYLELSLPEVLTRTRALSLSPWARITIACFSPEVLTSLSQRHATIAALFDRFGSQPNALNQRASAMLSPVQQRQQMSHINAQEAKSNNNNTNNQGAGGGPPGAGVHGGHQHQQQQHGHYPPLATAAWEMTTPRSRASAAVLPQDAFPVPHLMVTISQARKMLECSGSSDSTPVMPAILTVSGFKQIIETVSVDAQGVALNFSEFQLFLAIVADRCCKFEDAPAFDSGLAPPAPGANTRPLHKAIAGKIHHLVQFLAA